MRIFLYITNTLIYATLFFVGVALTSFQVNADANNARINIQKEGVEKSISTKSTTPKGVIVSDIAIHNRIKKIISELGASNQLRAVVDNRIITISGEVNSASVQENVEKLAKQIDGVVEVNNEVVVALSVEEQLETTWSKILKVGKQTISNLPLFIIAIAVFSLFWLTGGWVSKRKSMFSRVTQNAFIATLLGQITHIFFIIIGLVIGLSLLDATALIGTILGAAGIFGLAIGFAVRDTVENYIASILLSIRNPFETNDYVDIDGNEGSVARLTSRATILITADGNHLRIPNAQVFKAIITNFTRNSVRRFSFDLGVDSAQDLDEAQLLAIETLKKIEGVLGSPKPIVLIEKLGDFNVIIRVYGWVDQSHYSFGKVSSEAIKKVKVAFDNADIIMPEPIYQVRMSENVKVNLDTQVRVETKRNIQEENKKNISKKASQETGDVKPDKTAKKHIEEEHADANNENLLNSDAPSE